MNMQKHGWLYWLAWILAFGFVLLAVYLGWKNINPVQSPISETTPKPTSVVMKPNEEVPIPNFAIADNPDQLQRKANIDTEIPNRPRSEIIEYTVQKGDSVFAISAEFDITPETVLWSNYDVL